MAKKQTEPTKYDRLTEALKIARDAALALGRTEDGGTCNFDSLELYLPRWNEAKTIAAIEAACLHGYRSNYIGVTVYIICPPDCGQANDRTRKAQAMKKAMPAEYDASVYYHAD